MLRTLVSSDYLVIVLKNFSLETLLKVFKYLSSFKDSVEVLVNLKTSPVAVSLNNVRRYIVIPPLTFFIRSEGSNDLINMLLSLDTHIYRLLDDVWMECKRFPNALSALADIPVLDILSDLGLGVRIVDRLDEVLESGDAVLVSCDGCLDPTILNDLVLKLKVVTDLRSFRGVGKTLIRGYLRTYFKDHILTYGVGSEELQVCVGDHSILNKLLIYGKPLIHLNSKVLALELPNKSLIFTADLMVLKEFLIRSLLYVF